MSLSAAVRTALAYAFGGNGTALSKETCDAIDNSSFSNVSGDATIAAGGALTIAAGAVTQAKSAPNSYDQTIAANVLDANVIGGLTSVIRIDIAAGALASKDVVMTNKVRVIDAYLILRGAGVATTTLQVKNGATAITDAMAASGAAKAIVRAASIDSAQWEIAAAGTLRVTSATGATQPDATVFVTVIRVP